MQRLINYYLRQWAENPSRKPLVLRGARQVGKTHAVRQLSEAFEDIVEINFELNPRVNEIFDQDLEPERIVRALALIAGKRIIPGKTLLFLDEIQEAPRAITALRYFYEKLPNLHVIAAGSLLDFALESISVPVGRITFLYMHPLSFIEFLKALGQELLIEEIINHAINIPLEDPVHQKLLEYLGIYMAVGGMPEAVQCWISSQDITECANVHHSLADTYRQDFQKYSKQFQLKYLNLLFEQIPSQLTKLIKYSHLSKEYRKRDLEPCLELLTKANIIHKILHSSGQGIPLGAEANVDKFKLIFLDIALSQAILGLDCKEWVLDPQHEFINKGALTEAMIGQELLAYANPMRQPQLYYWLREARGSSAEVDYLVQDKQLIIPVEVKSKFGGSLKSLQIFLQTHEKSSYGIRFSIHNYSSFDHVHSYPLYAVAGVFGEDKIAILDLVSR